LYQHFLRNQCFTFSSGGSRYGRGAIFNSDISFCFLASMPYNNGLIVPVIPTRARPMPIILLHAITFLAAFLLFQIELIVAKALLPVYGGSYAVWGACLVFFQAFLLLDICSSTGPSKNPGPAATG